LKEEKKMTMFEFAETIIKMPVDKQNSFFEELKKELSEEDWMTTVKFVSLFGLFKSPVKYEAMKNAVCDMVCEDIFGATVEKKKKIDDPCNPVFMTSIL
jgi:hypothetical protein